MNSKSILVAAGLLASCMLASAAVTPITINPATNQASFSDISGSSSVDFSFTVSASDLLVLSATSTYISKSKNEHPYQQTSGFNITGLYIDGVKVGADNEQTSATSDGVIATRTTFDNWSYRPVPGYFLSAGQHIITVEGTSVAGGGFSGNLQITPVPEPETYALMLAGLGAVGFVARRRKAA